MGHEYRYLRLNSQTCSCLSLALCSICQLSRCRRQANRAQLADGWRLVQQLPHIPLAAKEQHRPPKAVLAGLGVEYAACLLNGWPSAADPASDLEWQRIEQRFAAVLGAQALLYHLELQLAHRSENGLGAKCISGVERLDGT